jgi:GT2 family glycosyltransferase
MARKLTIQLLGWNGTSHLRTTARVLQDVPQHEVTIRYIDNASEDASVEIVTDLLPHAEIIRLPHNIGFAGAHNSGIALCNTPYILTLDQDISIEWEGVKKLIEELDSNPKLGAVQGKLHRTEGSRILDSAGIIQTLALNGKERGSNEKDTGQYEERAKLLAVTGGCGMYRIDALKSVAKKNEFFDEDFFAYKEDVDLGWRLNKKGWEVMYIPVLVGHHARTMGKRGIFNWGIAPRSIALRIANNRTRLSLRNYIWMLAKNMTWKDELKHDVFIASRLSVLFILSLFNWNLFTAWKEALGGIHKMHEKRK